MHTEQLHEQYAIRIAADLDAGHSLTVEDRLADLGLTEAQIAAAAQIIEDSIERTALHQTAQVIRRIFLHLAGCNAQTAALARALGFTEESLDEIGVRLGMSKQGLGNLVAKIQPMLGPLAPERKAQRAPEFPPAPAGETWVTVPQARKLTGRSVEALHRAMKGAEVHWVQMGNRFFFDEASLLAWQEAQDVAAAQDRLTPSLGYKRHVKRFIPVPRRH